MAVAHVQFASQREDTSTTSVTVTLGSAPTTGNVLVFVAAGSVNPDDWRTPLGFTKLDPDYNTAAGGISGSDVRDGFQVYYRVVESGDGTSYTATHLSSGHKFGAIVEVSGAGTPVVRSAPFSATTGVYFSGQDATVQASSYAFMVAYTDYQGASWSVTTPTDFTQLLDSANSTQGMWCGYDIGATTISDLAVTSGGGDLCGMLIEIPESGTTLTPWDGANFVTVKPSGGSYTTFTAAIADTDIRNGVYQVQLASNTVHTESTYVNLTTGTEAIASYKRYLHLTAAPANRHSGVPGTGHARIDSYFSFNLRAYCGFTRISHLELIPDTHAIDVEAYTNNGNFLFDNLILNASSTSSSNDAAIELPNHNKSVTVVNCVYSGSPHSRKQAIFTEAYSWLYVAHCSFDGYVNADMGYAPSTHKIPSIFVHNNWFRPGSSYYAINYDRTDKRMFVYGTGNIYEGLGAVETAYFYDSTYDWQKALSFTTTTTTADAVIVTNTSDDFTPVAATGSGENLVLGRGVNAQNNPIDPRADLSLDIAGNARPTTNVDIGAFQISEGGDVPTGTPIKVWTGSAWVNVNSLSYYDGGWS